MVAESVVLAFDFLRAAARKAFTKEYPAFSWFPLIAYSIAAGLAAETVDRVIVSTTMKRLPRSLGSSALKRRSFAPRR